MSEKLCARCGMKPRHVTSGGKTLSLCIDCERQREKDKKTRLKEQRMQTAKRRVLLVYSSQHTELCQVLSEATPRQLEQVVAFHEHHGTRIIYVKD